MGACVKSCKSWQTFILIYPGGFAEIRAMRAKALFLAAAFSTAAGVIAAQYDVAAYVWPAFQPDPRWA